MFLPLPWLRALSAEGAWALMPKTAAGSAVLALVVLGIQRLLQPAWPPVLLYPLVGWVLTALVVSVALIPAAKSRNGVEGEVLSPAAVTSKAYALALQAAILLLPVALWLLVWRNSYDAQQWSSYGLLNKRWLAALYLLFLATIFVFPLVFRRLHAVPAPAPPPESPALAAGRSPWQLIVGLLVAVVLAWFFVGPPWHVAQRHVMIDHHAQAHLGALQAIDKGFLPYIGPASTQYGAGSQLFTYTFMKAVGRFDIVGFRESSVAIHLVVFAAVMLLAYLHLGTLAVPLVAVLGVAYSPLGFFQFGEDGIINGWWGWGNSARYLGPLLVVPLLPLAIRQVGSRPFPAWAALGAGIGWGVCAWISQESGSTTLIAIGLFLAMAWAAENCSLADLVAILGQLAAGFALVWTPILFYYLIHGAAGEFIQNYFLVSGAVAMGFSNTWWSDGPTPQLRTFHLTPLVIAALGTVTILDLPRRQLRRGLDAAQLRVLAFLSALAASYMTALFRSDAAHLQNTMLALPFVILLAVRDVPAWVGRGPAVQWVGRLVIAATIWYIFPIGPTLRSTYVAAISAPLQRFFSAPEFAAPPLDAPASETRIPFLRATTYLTDEPVLAAGSVSMREFLEVATSIRELVGSRPTLVEGFPANDPGLIYFMLDLTPAPQRFNRSTMILNAAMWDQEFEYFRQHFREVDCVITENLTTRIAQMFVAEFPAATVVEKTIGGRPVYVIRR